MTARRLLALLGALLAASPAAAYVRSKSGKGVPLSWPLPVVPYHVSSATPVHPSPSCEPAGASDPALDAVRAGFDAWRAGCASLSLVYAGRVDEIRVGLQGMEENLVVFRNGWCSEDPAAIDHPCFRDVDLDCGGIFGCFEDAAPGDRNIVALTTVIHDPDTGRIYDADIEVNGWDGQGAGDPITPPSPGIPRQHGWWFTCGDPAGLPACATYGERDCAFIDLQNTMTHEAGHFLGLAHPCEGARCTVQPELRPYTMYPSTGPGETEKRTLHADDVAGLCAIYPAEGGGCGCGAGSGPGTLALLAAGLGLGLVVRRRRVGPVDDRSP